MMIRVTSDVQVIGSQVSDRDANSGDVDFNDCGMLWMGVPKRKKSVKMKRIERNRAWKVCSHISVFIK